MTTLKMKTIRDRLLESVARRYVTVQVPDVGEVTIQSLTELERVEIAAATEKDPRVYRATLIQKTIVDEHQRQVFSKADIESILSLDFAITSALYAAINKHIEGKATEDHEKNSDGTQDGYTSVT